MIQEASQKEKLNLLALLTPTVVVAALGYFVDIYDLILFSIVRIKSLKEIGLDGHDLTEKGLFILNSQMIGMLAGGILWGVMGDKRGRLRVLYGSILLYSLANIANGFVTSVPMYALVRFIAGVGLAGELGAGITLVAETTPKAFRGVATSMVVGFGVVGALLANLIAEYFTWRTCYFIGGGLGLALLLLRMGITESEHFNHAKESSAKRGQFFILFQRKELFRKYLLCILVGLPVWYVIGILFTLAPEFAKALHVQGVVVGRVIAFGYAGAAIGDFFSGIISHAFKSRKTPLLLYIAATIITCGAYFLLEGASAALFYFVCFLMGIATGFWVLFITVAAEQFGTNIRATVATTVPNFVRGAVLPITSGFLALSAQSSILFSGIVTGLVVFTLSLLGWYGLKESYHTDLDFLEADAA